MQAVTTKRKRRPKGVSDEALDAWTQGIAEKPRCTTCAKADVAETIQKILDAQIRNRVRVTLKDFHKKVQELHDNYNTGFWGFRHHLYNCEADRYAQVQDLS